MERKLNTCPWHPWPGISSSDGNKRKAGLNYRNGWMEAGYGLGKHIASVGQATWSGKLHLRARLDH